VEQLRRIFELHRSETSELERIKTEVPKSIRSVDQSIEILVEVFPFSGAITRQLPGVRFDDLEKESGFYWHAIDPAVVVEWHRKYFECPIRLPGRTIQTICDIPSRFFYEMERPGAVGDHWIHLWDKTFNDLVLPFLRRNSLQQMLWRLQDLRDGGGLGFTVELFFLSLKELLSPYSSERPHSALYIGTFRALTSDWNKYKHSLGTQKLLLEMSTSHHQRIIDIFILRYPTYIRDEFLVLLGNVFAGQRGPHIDDAVQQLVNCYNQVRGEEGRAFVAKALEVLTRAGRAPPS